MYTVDTDVAIVIQLTTIKIRQRLNNRSIDTRNGNNTEIFLGVWRALFSVSRSFFGFLPRVVPEENFWRPDSLRLTDNVRHAVKLYLIMITAVK